MDTNAAVMSAHQNADEMDEFVSKLLSRINAHANNYSGTSFAELFAHIPADLTAHVMSARSTNDVDTLRMYSKVRFPTVSFQFAHYALNDLKELDISADAVTPQILADYSELVQSRADAIWSASALREGNAEILRLLIEVPSSRSMMNHMINKLGITEVSELVREARFNVSRNASAPLMEGTL